MIFWYFLKVVSKHRMNSPRYTTIVLKVEETKRTEIKSKAMLGYDKENEE